MKRAGIWTVVLIKDATHFVLFEKPRFQFFDEILRFLRE